MYRVLTTSLSLVMASTISHANTPSITTLRVVSAQATPSIVYLGTPAPLPLEARSAQGDVVTADAATEVLHLGPSLIAVGADAIPTASEDVAATPEAPAAPEPTQPIWMSQALPMIIRGTELVSSVARPATENTGDAFTSPQPLDSQTH